MANEAIQVEGPYEVHDFTITDGDSVSALTLMTLEDARGTGASSADGAAFAGILVVNKTATDGNTEVGHYVKGVFNLTAVTTIGDEGAIDFGDPVVVSGINLIRAAEAADLLTGAIVGKAWESIAAGTTGEVHVGAYA